MQRPEDPADQFTVPGTLLQFQECGFQLGKELAGLFQEGLPEMIDHPITFLTTARSCSGRNGLVIQAVAPAARASCFRASWDSVVSMITGVNLEDGFARMPRIRPIPSRLGMFRSVITMSTASPFSLARPSLPSRASMTRYPFCSSVKDSIMRTLAESSTAKIVLLICHLRVRIELLRIRPSLRTEEGNP